MASHATYASPARREADRRMLIDAWAVLAAHLGVVMDRAEGDNE